MSMDATWSNLEPRILILILHKLDFLGDYLRSIAVCKSWRNSVSGFDLPSLPPDRFPFLLLAEDVAPGTLTSDCEFDSDQEDHCKICYDEDSAQDISGGDDDDDEEYYAVFTRRRDEYNHLNNTVGSSRGLYNLSTGKTYVIDLPEAAGRILLGITKGWLVTIGRDLQLHLLHPLLRHQISLPSMLSFSRQFQYHQVYPPEEASDIFIKKVAVSSQILYKNTIFSSYHHHASPPPVLMAIYGENNYLGFAKLGDKVWTDVKLPLVFSHGIELANFEDIVYHKGNFYVVDCRGGIFVCGNDDNGKGGYMRGRQIASFETKDWVQKYLVESSSGSGLLLLARYRKQQYFDQALPRRPKYRTTNFSVWRLDLKYSDSLDHISCTNLKEEKYLGNEAIFIGKTSSVAVSSSESIKPNSIYFTDDNLEYYNRQGGGHDMGIFNLEHRTRESHFPGKSIHPISPPLWYF